MKFPFGKYAGDNIADIPTSYLVYAIENFTLGPALKETLSNEIKERLGLESFISSTAVDPDELQIAYRQLSKKWHPDMGGNKEAMQAINEFYKLLKA